VPTIGMIALLSDGCGAGVAVRAGGW